MAALLKLTISNLTTRKARVGLTIAAIAFSVSLVVAITTGYRSFEEAAFKFLNTFLGSTDAEIISTDHNMGKVPESLVALMAADEATRQCVGRLESEVLLGDKKQHPTQIKGIRRPDDREVEKLKLEAGSWFDTSTGDIAVIDQVAAENANVQVGGTIIIPGVDKKLPLKVVGIIHKPTFLAKQTQSVYVPLETFQQFLYPNDPQRLSRVMVSFKSGTDAQAFADRWRPKIEKIDPQLKLMLAKDRKQEMSQKLEALSMLSLLGGAVSMLAASFIVFSTLSMGVTERQRTLAMLRAIGAYRSQLGFLVIGEGLLLAAIGVIIGVPLGLFWVQCLAWKYWYLFLAGVHPAMNGILFGSIGSLVSALVAGFIPALQAMKASPLEAMSPLASASGSRIPWKAALFGLLLIAVDPFLFYGGVDWIVRGFGSDPLSSQVRGTKLFLHFALGLPGTMIGFFLLGPIFVVAIDRLCSPIVAATLGIRLALVRQQLATGLWRAAGTCAALMVGLSILVVMQVQGHSMLESWQLPTRFPDLFLVSLLQPLNDDEFAKLAETPGLVKGEVMPLNVFAPGLGTGFLSVVGSRLIPDRTMFFGVDPEKAFKLMDLDFREGNAHDAEVMLKKGRHLIITEEFTNLKGLHIGDTLTLETSRNGPQPYTIAGVVWSPGLDVIVGLYDLGRQMDQQTAASIFGTTDDAKRDFGAEGAEFFVANIEPGIERDEILRRVKKEVRALNMQAFDVRQIKYDITNTFSNLLMLVTVVPLAAMAVASLGVTNTILASIRTRSWQFGILRSIGLTRSQLLRLVTAEAIVLAMVGVAMGLAAGFMMVLNARGLYATTIGFMPPTRVPWNMIWLGVGAVVVVTMLASLFPAIGVSRKSPLTLLQAGRAAT